LSQGGLSQVREIMSKMYYVAPNRFLIRGNQPLWVQLSADFSEWRRLSC
jgi:hypothetical protein